MLRLSALRGGTVITRGRRHRVIIIDYHYQLIIVVRSTR